MVKRISPLFRSAQKDTMNGNATTIGKNIVIYPESPFLKTSTEDSIGSVRRIFLSRVKSDSNTEYDLSVAESV